MIKRVLLATIGLCVLSNCNSVAQEAPAKLIPVVYSSKSTISLFGLEKMHPFDSKKYDKIHRGLKSAGYITKETTF